MGTKLGSVYFDVKGNKGDLGTEKNLIPTPSNPASFQPPFTPQITQKSTNWPKTAPVFFDLPDSAPVCLYMTISRLKMTANSTYWRGDNPKNDLHYISQLTAENHPVKRRTIRCLGSRSKRHAMVGRSGGNKRESRIPHFTSENATWCRCQNRYQWNISVGELARRRTFGLHDPVNTSLPEILISPILFSIETNCLRVIILQHSSIPGHQYGNICPPDLRIPHLIQNQRTVMKTFPLKYLNFTTSVMTLSMRGR